MTGSAADVAAHAAAGLTALPAAGAERAAWLQLALPAAGAVALLLGGRRTDRWGHLVGVRMPVAAFAYGLVVFAEMLGQGRRARELTMFTWIVAGRFHVTADLLLDQLSICFVLLITGVGSLIHIFTVGYMDHDPERRRFFGYMNLFVVAMLLLVLADNYVALYAGWEGVGLASYLLIGFWSGRPVAATAGTKAFVMNRVGDANLSLAIMVMFASFGTVTFSGVFRGTAALIGSGLTALYVSRMLLMTFTGARRWDEGRHPHEAPRVMTWPAILLAIGSLGGGAFLILGNRLVNFLAPVTGTPPASPGLFTPVSLGALALVVAAASLGWAMYGRRAVPATAPAAGFAVTAARRDLYGDAFNESVLMRPGQWLIRLSVFFDNRGVDGLVNAAAAAVGGSSGRLRRVQNGMVRTDFLTMLAGAVLLVGMLLAVRL